MRAPSRSVVLLPAFLVPVFLPALLSAQTTDVIRACVHGGQIRMIAPGESCRQNETLLVWNIQGPKGDTGAEGPEGPPGPPGPGFDTGTGAIAGQVASCDPQAPLAMKMVTVLGQSFTAYTNAEGQFKLSYLPPGLYDVDFPALPKTLTGVIVNAGATTDLGLIYLTDLQNDPANCGTCGVSCPSGACAGGACVSLCPEGQVKCNGVCTDLSTDPNNCGACGGICTGGKICSGGACQCPQGSYFCPSMGVCVANCVACAGATFACVAKGSCVSQCTADCEGTAACQATGSCIAGCASCPAQAYTCTQGGNRTCVSMCTNVTCPAPSLCVG